MGDFKDAITFSTVATNSDHYKAFFEDDNEDSFTISSVETEKPEKSADGATTVRVGRNPPQGRQPAEFYDEFEDYEDKTDFRVKEN